MKLNIIATLLSLGLSTATLSANRAFDNRLQVQAPSIDAPDPTELYPAYTFSTAVDHFHNDSLYEPHSDAKYDMRYWFDASHYKPGGPVIALMAGETSGVGRLVFMQKGILAQMAKETNGIAVVIEHRYYGESFPVPDLTVENLRFLTTDQSLADTTDFAKNVKFKGLEKYNLNAPHTAWIAYGGSYAGAYAAFLRKLYPDTWWGAISSSGVTKAQWNFWQYFEAARNYGPKECVKTTQFLTNAMDNIFIKNKKYGPTLKKAFGMEDIEYDDDFMNVLGFSGIGGLQGLNWDPEVSSEDFNYYCGNISSDKIEYPETVSLKSTAQELLDAGGYGGQKKLLTPRLLNWIGWVNQTVLKDTNTESILESYGNHNASLFQDTSLSSSLAWPWQYCTQWGYIQSSEGVPKNILPLISKLVDIEYSTAVCRDAFNITKPADTEAINKYGGFDLFYERLAHVGGERDPWRWVTPLGDQRPKRPNTIEEPFFNIKNGVHHWDENGRFKNETTPALPPKPVADAQAYIRKFVSAWVAEWHKTYY